MSRKNKQTKEIGKNKKNKTREKSKEKREYQCSVRCTYFPNMECLSWEYDKEKPYIKRRTDGKEWTCGFDGHIIKDWFDNECPLKNIK